ncbi:MAG: hypothetical protein AB7F98_06990 [Novosphingobium sp.]
MKIRLALAATATLALAACGGGDQPAGEASQAAATPAAAPAKGDKPTKEFVVGKWGTDGDCALAMDLKADGTSDGPFGNWTYADGVISFAEAPELKVNVTVIDDKTMESKNSGGKTSKMTRCP